MSFSGSRLARLRKALGDCGTCAMYVRDTANIEWLTGFENVFDDERAHAMFIVADGERAFVHTDSRYSTAMEREAEGLPIEVDIEALSMGKWAAQMWKAHGADDLRLAIEDGISLREYRALEEAFDGSPFVETDGLVVGLRAAKDVGEIARLRAAQAVTDAAFEHIVGFIKPGMTEREVQLELDGYMLRHGATGLAFPTIIASGTNGASPHAIVSDKVLEPGECIVMDFGARKDGYCSDMTRTVFLGEPEGEMLAAWEAMRAANEYVEQMLRPGVTGREAHEAAIKILDDRGFAGRMGHGLGHGVGIEIHELPVLSSRNDKPLVAGNVVTVEPGVYLPGRFGMRLEDFGVVTDDGFEVFTQSTHDLVVV